MPQQDFTLRAPSGDEGFSLVEAVVALAIATAIFTALAFALVGGAKSALLSQQNQQAGDVLNQEVERVRALSFGSLAMRPADLNTGEAVRTPTIAGCACYNPTNDSTSGAGVEPLVAPDANGGIDVHVKPVTQNNGTYTVRRYLTRPADASGAVYKRLTVVVTWNGLGKTRTRSSSTLISDSKRGLPLPDFKYTNAATLSQCRNPGSETVYSFNVKNNGARDSWALTASPSTPNWSYVADSNGNGVYEASLDTVLPVSAGVPETGLLEPTTAIRFFAVTTLPGTPGPYVISTVFRARSLAQPAYFQELTALTSVQNMPCGAVAGPSPSPTAVPVPPLAPTQPLASCPSLQTVTTNAPSGTMIGYYPGNPSQPGSTAAAFTMPVARNAGMPPAASLLYNFSTDLHTAAGRNVDGTAATWSYSMPATSVLKGNGEVTVWAATPTGSLTARPDFAIVLQLFSPTGDLLGTIDTATYATPSAGWNCAGFRPVSVSFGAIPNDTVIAANQQLRLSVRVTNSVPMRLAYGTQAYPMTMTLPFKSGLG